MGLITGDLDLEGQIGLETLKYKGDSLSMQQLLNCGNFKFNLELCIDHLKVLDYS